MQSCALVLGHQVLIKEHGIKVLKKEKGQKLMQKTITIFTVDATNYQTTSNLITISEF